MLKFYSIRFTIAIDRIDNLTSFFYYDTCIFKSPLKHCLPCRTVIHECNKSGDMGHITRYSMIFHVAFITRFCLWLVAGGKWLQLLDMGPSSIEVFQRVGTFIVVLRSLRVPSAALLCHIKSDAYEAWWEVPIITCDVEGVSP